MSAKELRLYNQIIVEINLKTSDDATASNFREVDNGVYFTWEQFVVGLRLLVPLMVKKFMKFTRLPPTLVHLNAFQILMSCSVLNSVYQLDILLVDICFIYTLKLGTGPACPCRPIVPGCNS